MRNIIKSIKLDHDVMKSRYPMLVIAYVIGIFFAVVTKIPVYGALITMLISAPIAGQYFSIYEKNNLEKLYGILPLRKYEVVTGRYLYAMCIIVINGVFAAAMAYVISLITKNGMSGVTFLTYLSGGFLYACLMIAVLFPLYFKYSFSKVYIISNLPFYVLFVVGFALTRKTNVLQQTGPAIQSLTSNFAIAAIVFGLGLVLLALSCLLSCALAEGNRATGLAAEEPGKRLYFADNLRTWMVILVVLQHLAEIFGLYLFLMVNQAYFMGLLFLLSGYFTPGSYERKGPSKFLTDRLLRLGVPTLVYVFVISPLEKWGSHLISHKPVGILFSLDQMWFVVMLLVFDLGYLMWRTFMKNRTERPAAQENRTKLTFPKVAFFTLALAAASYLVRIILPYGIPVLQFPSLGYLAQYLSFFLIGMLAFRQGWLRSVAGSLGKLGFVFAMLASAILFPVAVIGSGSKWIGYGSWQSAVFALWDSIFAVGISLALITFFRRFLDGGKAFGQFLSKQSFAVYVIHVPVIVFLILALSGLKMAAILKFGLAAAVCLPVCFGVAWLIRKIPYVNKIM